MSDVNIQSYLSQGLSGFGSSSESQLVDLQKALTAGYQVSSQTGGSALRVESLEGSLKVTTFNLNHVKMWKRIPKSPAYSTVEEYNQLTAYGPASNAPSAFLQEAELAPETDATYLRQTAFVKFIGTTRQVSHQMTVVHPAHGDVIALETQNGIKWLVERVEDALFHGDSTLVASGEGEQWNGLDAQIDSTSVVDLAGNPMQEADIELGANTLLEAYAYPTDLFLGNRPNSDLTKTFYPKERYNMPAPQNGVVGMALQTIITSAGPMDLQPDVFLRKQPSPPAAATHSNAPNTPASVSFAAVAGTDGNFNKGVGSGTDEYAWCVTACNRFGESAPVFVSATTAFTQANKDLGVHTVGTITNAATIGPFAPQYFRIYRTARQAASSSVPSAVASYSLVTSIPAGSVVGGGTSTWTDVNFRLPFTFTAYMGQMTPDVLTFRQLLPMMKLDLAVVAPAYRFMIMLYGTPILFAPKKWLRFINIGQLGS